VPAIHTETAVVCWKCRQPPEDVHFCRRCGSLQAPAADYFSFLGLPQKLQIDRAHLEGRFYELSRRLHPDRYVRRSAEERRLAEEATARLNDAYRTLRDPVARAEYLLALHGLDKKEQNSSNTPPELLEEVFELNMALEELRRGDESARPQLEAARQKFAAMAEDLMRSLDACFAEWDREGRRETLEKIYGVLNRRNYVRNLLRDADG
jgi:molecular chaperone HscB